MTETMPTSTGTAGRTSARSNPHAVGRAGGSRRTAATVQAADPALMGSVLDALSHCVILADQNMTIRFVNAAAMERFRALGAGIPVGLDELVGSSVELARRPVQR